MQNTDLEVYEVDAYDAHAPKEQINKGYWCPYCRTWDYWKTNRLGYKACQICGIGDSDFYVKNYNKLWNRRGMESKSQKKKQENIQKKVRRRSKK